MAKRIAITDRMLASQLNLLRLEGGVRQDVLQELNKLQRRLVSQLASEDLTDFNKKRVQSLLAQTKEVIDDYYARIAGKMDSTLSTVGDATSQHTGDSVEAHFVGHIDASLPSDTLLAKLAGNTLIQGAPSAAWWERQSADTAFRFANVVRQGIIQGDPTETIVARVAGRKGFTSFMDVARSNARSLVHTSIMEVAAEARKETYKQNDDVVKGTRQVSTLDSHTTEICIAYDGAEFDLDGEPIGDTDLPYDGGCPRHWGCRSVEVPITATFKDLGLDIPEPAEGERASADGPVPEDTTFDEFLGRMGTEFQDETLGEGRAQLWRDDKITLQQLLDLRGNPLTLDELREKFG
jgi:hypothetical protein